MKRLALAAIAALLSAPAWSQVDFDQGVDVKALLARLPPAPSGMSMVLFRQDPGGITVAFQDRQAGSHIGGTTRLVIKVKEQRGLMIDPVIFDIDMTQPVGPYYEFSFKDKLGKLKPGAKYYVEWSWQRQGQQLRSGGRSEELTRQAFGAGGKALL